MDTAQSRRNALGRLVAHENNASDLLAFLFELDPRPMTGLLGLEDGPYTCWRGPGARRWKRQAGSGGAPTGGWSTHSRTRDERSLRPSRRPIGSLQSVGREH